MKREIKYKTETGEKQNRISKPKGSLLSTAEDFDHKKHRQTDHYFLLALSFLNVVEN